MTKHDDEGGVRSAELTLDVLEAVAFSGEELGVTEIASRVGATKGSVYRHLTTLVARGYLTQNATTSRYGIGAKSRVLSGLAPATDIARVAEDAMRDLRDKLGHTVVLSLMMPRGALVVSTLVSRSSIEIGVRPGSELPFHASAQGKVMLAYAPEKFRRSVIGGGLPSLTVKTVSDAAAIEDELALVRKQGFATAPEQVLLGINSIAAPVFDQTDECVAAVAIVGSIQFLHSAVEKNAILHLKKCARKISQKLGHGRATRGGRTPLRQAAAARA